jgi:hypothetical protein
MIGMLQRKPLISRFVSKLFGELLPATIASAVGAVLFGHLAMPAPKAPTPVAVTATISDDMVIQVVRAEQALAEEHKQERKAEVAAVEPIKPVKVVLPPSRPKVATRIKPKPIEVAALAPPPVIAAKASPGEPLVLAQAAMAPAPAEVHHEERGMLRKAWDTVGAVPDRIRATVASLMDDTPPRPPMPLPEPLKVTM